MAIMGYKEWKQRTKHALKPRSKSLRFLDACLQDYELDKGSLGKFNWLTQAFHDWAGGKDNAETSIRNANGAVTDLMNQMIAFREQHMPFAKPSGPGRPAGLLRDIREGAKLLRAGMLKPAGLPTVKLGVTDTGLGTVCWEEFEDRHLPKIRKAWKDAYECAQQAAAAAARVGSDAAERNRFARWFGNPAPAAVQKVQRGTQALWTTFQSHRVTVVYREFQVMHLVNGKDPFGEMIDDEGMEKTYALVHNHQAGSGYRIVAGPPFLNDPDPIEGPAQTIYHELTHKVLNTVDHGYGKNLCLGYATSDQPKALANADNWAYYAVSFKKAI